MKKLHFHYKMDLKFDSSVREHHMVLKCRPMEGPGQKLLSFSCRTDPNAPLCEVLDGFGNHAISCVIREPHDHVSVWAEGSVERERFGDTCFHPVYAYPSAYTEAGEDMKQFAAEALKRAGTAACLERACMLMECMQDRISYVPGVTGTATTAQEAFLGGRGVCQDYAHILTALCRCSGIPARYAAGMMVGEGASHAWVEVWTGSVWTGLDPTHNRLVDDRYIKLSHGRDFADAAIDRGCFLGAAGQQQTIYIKVDEK